jgi:hypothetical protein
MRDTAAPPELTEAQLRMAMAVADVLLPEDDDLPSGAQVDPHGRFLRRSMQAVPRTAQQLPALLDRLDGNRLADDLAQLERDEPERFDELLTVIMGAYLTNRKVWKRLGYPGRRTAPALPDETEFYLRDDVLGPVLRRGRFLREPTILENGES